MNEVLMVLSFIIMVIGLIGCFIPFIPGPPLSYIGIWLIHFSGYAKFSTKFFIIFGVLTLVVSLVDYIMPIWGTKKFGGSKAGIWGSALGLLLGIIFFPPIGIIIGPLAGAMIGELLSGKKTDAAFKAAFGSFIGFLFGTVMKFVISGLMLFYSIKNLL